MQKTIVAALLCASLGSVWAQAPRMGDYIPKGINMDPMGTESNDDLQSTSFDTKTVCAGAAKAARTQDGNWTFIGGGGAVETASPQEYVALRRACGLPPLRRP